MYGTLSDDGKLDVSYVRALVTYNSYLGPIAQAEIIVDEVAKHYGKYLSKDERDIAVKQAAEMILDKYELLKIIDTTAKNFGIEEISVEKITEEIFPEEEILEQEIPTTETLEPEVKGDEDMTHNELKQLVVDTYDAADSSEKSKLHEAIATEIFDIVPDSPMGIDDVIYTLRQEIAKIGGDWSKYDFAFNEAVAKAGGPVNYIAEPVVTPPSKDDNTMLYVGIGVGLFVLYMMFK